MIVTIVWALGFCIGMLLTVPILLLCYLVRFIFGNRIGDKYTYIFTRFWGRSIILTTGSTVSIIGLENIPQEANVCFVSNHQSFFDIPLLMGWLNRPIGFIAKKELKKIPVLNGWITAIHSAFIDRSNPRKAIESINKGSDSIRNGHPIAIFPEGTRSKTGLIAEFKTGSLKLATNAKAIIQPITISGTFNIYEAKKRIHKSKITLQIHSPINPKDEIYKDKIMLTNHLHHVIANAESSAENKR